MGVTVQNCRTRSCSLRCSNPQTQRVSEEIQFLTSTTRPPISVLGLIICSDNNISLRAVTLCGLELPFDHALNGSDAVYAQHWQTSLSLCLFTFCAAFQTPIDLVLRLLSPFALLSP
jgi:hypothetical protein